MNKTYLTDEDAKKILKELQGIADRLGDEVPYTFVVQRDSSDEGARYISMGRFDNSIDTCYTIPEIRSVRVMNDSDAFRDIVSMLSYASDETLEALHRELMEHRQRVQS